jgi:HlyD family secretion protein
VTGTIQNLAGVYPGSPVFVNQDLAQISPETNLIAEAYVSPNDVGLLHQGMPVLMQVSAFNYNQWGLLHGEVQEISNDIQMQNDRPVFEIKCRLSQDHLSLKNGYQGKLKKGMSFQACFVVAKRSLWQLLYDKVDDWVNPNIAIRKRRP